VTNKNFIDKRKALRVAYKKLKTQSDNFKEDMKTFHKNYQEPEKKETPYLYKKDYLIEAQANKARAKAAQTKYEQDNKDKISVYQKEYRLQNLEEYKQRQKEYYQKKKLEKGIYVFKN